MSHPSAIGAAPAFRGRLPAGLGTLLPAAVDALADGAPGLGAKENLKTDLFPATFKGSKTNPAVVKLDVEELSAEEQ